MISFSVNAEGYLLELNHWSDEIALQLAANEQLTLTEPHWSVLHYCHNFYRQYCRTPPTRLIVKQLVQEYGDAMNSSIINHLFPSGIRQICKLAGLPKPNRCI